MELLVSNKEDDAWELLITLLAIGAVMLLIWAVGGAGA
jgi:hypothetical protein